MKLNVKIISLLVIGFIMVSIGLTTSSIILLRKNQTENIQLFKEEFLELGQESFTDSSNLFFYSLENKIQTATSSSELISSIQTTNPSDIVVYSIPQKKFILEPKDQIIVGLLNQVTLNKDIQENVLNLKNSFDHDNFKDFIIDPTGKIYPVKTQLRFYSDIGLIVGYTKAYTTTKVRIEFIQRKNDQLFQSYIISALITVLLILIVSITVTVFFMQSIIINPLKKILLGLEQVNKGVLSTKIDIKNKDEIGKIANVFNSMTQDLEISKKKLEEYSGTLEQKIIERTTELNSKLNELEKMNKLMVDRELKMIDLKKQIRELEDQQVATT